MITVGGSIPRSLLHWIIASVRPHTRAELCFQLYVSASLFFRYPFAVSCKPCAILFMLFSLVISLGTGSISMWSSGWQKYAMLYIKTESAFFPGINLPAAQFRKSHLSWNLSSGLWWSQDEKILTANTTYVSIFALFFGENYSVYCAFQQAVGPELHQVANIDQNWRKWVTFCTGRPDRHTWPGHAWSEDLKTWLGGTLEEEG